tara:strand:+ start:47 stop:646 length:600 start_codon:yes stop_codon:yes gene_type:complete
MEEYVTDVVNMHYKTDADIMNDSELQHFAQDILDNGHTSPQFELEMASTKTNVVEMITTIVWTVSCQHSAMNFGQYKYLGFPLNAPMSIYVDPTHIKKKEYTSERIIMEKIMPSQHQIIKQISIAYILAAYGDNEEYLLPACGKYNEEYFTNPSQKAIVDKFLKQLKEADDVIEERNTKERKVPYLLVQPSKVPCSIAI